MHRRRRPGQGFVMIELLRSTSKPSGDRSEEEKGMFLAIMLRDSQHDEPT